MVMVSLESATRLRPATADELAAALHEADAHDQAVTPVGGGTQLDLGMPPARVDLVLETTGLDRVVEYEPADLTVTVEAGMRFDALQRLLGEHGQFLALDPPALEGATIGGIIATNASGPLRFAYGGPRDLVIGTRVANPDGTLTRAGGRVVKNVAGYDLNKLYIGSLGTLAVIVELSFKLAPIPPATATVVGAFESLDEAGVAVGAILRSPLSPLAIELLNRAAASAADVGNGVHVALRVGGYPQAVERQVRDLRALIQQHGGRAVDAAESAWDDLARMRVAGMRQDVVVKAAVPLSQSAAAMGLLEQQLAAYEPVVWAQAGNGVVYAACGADAAGAAGLDAQAAGLDAQVVLELRKQVQALGSNASLVVQRCPTVLKGEVDVWGDPGAAVTLMRTIKTKLDPHHTLNPGRYVGGI